MPLFLLANWKWVAGAVGGLTLMILGAYGASLHYRGVIADMKMDQVQQANDGLRQQLAQFTADADKIHEAADSYTALTAGLDTRFYSISKDFANAVKAHPLPVDCKPDTDRLRALKGAVDAANSAAGRIPLPAVPLAH